MLNEAIQRIVAQEDYLGHPNWAQLTGWMAINNLDLLVQSQTPAKTNLEPTPGTATLIASIDHTRLNVSPSGTYDRENGSLAQLKYQLCLTWPQNVLEKLLHDWDQAIQNLTFTTSACAKTANRPNLLLGEGSDRKIRLTAPSFVKRDPGSPDSDEDEIWSWPIMKAHKPVLDDIVDSHKVLRLPVWDENEKLIEPKFMTDAL